MDWTDEQVETLRRVLAAEGIDPDNIVEAIKKICEAMLICYIDLEKAMEQMAAIIRADAMETARALEEKRELLDLPNARDRKGARARRCAFERANAARFSQYKVRELSWKQRRGKRPHWREWRGPDKM